MKPFIHIHIPKTAGSTRAFILQKVYEGKVHSENLVLAGVNKKCPNYDNYDIITGHFFAGVYDHLPLVTFLREPVSRLISHYHHFLRSYKAYASNDAKGGLPWDYSEPYPRQEISLINFAETWPNLQTRYIECRRFEYIGVTENLDQCMRELSLRFEFEMPDKYRNYRVRPLTAKIEVSKELWQILEEINAEDVEFYKELLSSRSHL